jgi:hypothetical protein
MVHEAELLFVARYLLIGRSDDPLEKYRHCAGTSRPCLFKIAHLNHIFDSDYFVCGDATIFS